MEQGYGNDPKARQFMWTENGKRIKRSLGDVSKVSTAISGSTP